MTDQTASAPHAAHGLLHRDARTRLDELHNSRPVKVEDGHVGFNGKIALIITGVVGTMWAAYIFAGIGTVGIFAALSNDAFLVLLVGAVSGYFLQLVLLPIIIVGQNIQGRASDKRAVETYKDAEAILHECIQLQQHLEAQDKLLDDMVTKLQGILPSAG